jgi:transposase
VEPTAKKILLITPTNGESIKWWARVRIERFFDRIKYCWSVATRFEKHAANYLAMIKLASIRIWLRVNESMA